MLRRASLTLALFHSDILSNGKATGSPMSLLQIATEGQRRCALIALVANGRFQADAATSAERRLAL